MLLSVCRPQRDAREAVGGRQGPRNGSEDESEPQRHQAFDQARICWENCISGRVKRERESIIFLFWLSFNRNRWLSPRWFTADTAKFKPLNHPQGNTQFPQTSHILYACIQPSTHPSILHPSSIYSSIHPSISPSIHSNRITEFTSAVLKTFNSRTNTTKLLPYFLDYKSHFFQFGRASTSTQVWLTMLNYSIHKHLGASEKKCPKKKIVISRLQAASSDLHLKAEKGETDSTFGSSGVVQKWHRG